MTKNTKLHRIKFNKQSYIYRDLTNAEVCYLQNIRTETLRFEEAAKLALVKPTDTTDVPIGIQLQIGNNAYINSSRILNDAELFEITVKEFRQTLEQEDSSPMPLIGEILKVLPGQSITELMNLTFADLIEIACLCEKMTKQQILNVARPKHRSKGNKLVDPTKLPDDGKSLKEKIDELNSIVGIPR